MLHSLSKAQLCLIFSLLFYSFLGFSASSSDANAPPHKKMKVEEERPRLAVFLDLDECLIYATRSDQERELLKKNGNEYFQITFPRGRKEKKYTVFLRPGVREFIEKCTNQFDTYIFTASTEVYAKAITDQLDPAKKIKRIFSRNSCLTIHTHGKTFYFKDLNTVAIEQPIQRKVLVDNSVISFKNNISNGILITSWKGEQTTTKKFNTLLEVLSILSRQKDVRDLLGLFDLQERYIHFVNSLGLPPS